MISRWGYNEINRKKIGLINKEKINIENIVLTLEKDIKSVKDKQLNLKKDILELNNKIHDGINNINQIENDYKESFFSKL